VLKQTLMQSLESEQEKGIRNQICDAIGEIGATLYLMGNQWPDLIVSVFAMI
jgi:hypothetical protein